MSLPQHHLCLGLCLKGVTGGANQPLAEITFSEQPGAASRLMRLSGDSLTRLDRPELCLLV